MPTYSKTDICNLALLKMGEGDFIVNIEQDTSKNANTMKHAYDICRDNLLRDHNWRFAFQRQYLVQESTTILSDKWTYSYALPSDPDRMRVVDLPDYPNEHWEIEGESLLCKLNLSDLVIRYVSKITDTSKYPADFANALAAKLAYETVMTLSPISLSLKGELEQSYYKALKDAKGNNAIEATPEAYTPRSRMKSWATR